MTELPPGYMVRNARYEDLPRVIHINRSTLPENYHPSFFEEHLRKWGKAFYVAVYNGEVVGYVMCRVEWGFGFIRPGLVRRGHIISIAVLEDHRRRRLGTVLMKKALESLAREYRASEAYLEVRVSNTPAIRLYEKLGFRIVRRIQYYYLDGEDAYLMARPIP